MKKDESPRWLQWAREIQALAQTGLTYSKDEYQRQRYQRFLEIAAEITHSHSHLTTQSCYQNFLSQTGYATPKIDVRAAVIRDGKILLVQERSDERWCLPGGWSDIGDTPSETTEREVWEESGFKVKARKVIGVYDANREKIPIEFFHAYKIIFLCEIIGGEARPSLETMAVKFFTFDNLPPLSTARTGIRHLKEIQAHVSAPDRPAAFD